MLNVGHQRIQKDGIQSRPASPTGSLRNPEESWIDWGSFFQERGGEGGQPPGTQGAVLASSNYCASVFPRSSEQRYAEGSPINMEQRHQTQG